MLWRTGVMERSCAVARGKDINNFECAAGAGTQEGPTPNLKALRAGMI
jgi:hypothetical protein